MARGDLEWLTEDVGIDEDTALELLSAVDWAEMKRVIDIHGYPKDNVPPPSLASRLLDDRFRGYLKTAVDEMSDIVVEAYERAVEHARSAALKSS